MSSVAQHPIPIEDTNPYRYGRRYTRRVNDRGEVWYEESPLSLEDLLHPEEGDELVAVPGHAKNTRQLVTGLERNVPEDKTYVVLDDCNVDLGLPGVRPIRPDVGVIEVPEVPENFDDMGTFRLVLYQGDPLVFLEVTSDDTRKNDVGIKKQYYERAGVQQYVIVDRANPTGEAQLFGYLLGPQGYTEQQPDARGRLWLPAFGLWLGLEDGTAVLYDGDEKLPDYEQLARQRDDEKRRAEKEQRRANKEQRRAEKEQRRAEKEQRRAEKEQRRADDEKRRADLADERIRELQAELKRLQGHDP